MARDVRACRSEIWRGDDQACRLTRRRPRTLWVKDESKIDSISGARRRRQFGRSRSVPGRLVATVSPTRSSAWARTNEQGDPPTQSKVATTNSAVIGRSKSGRAGSNPVSTSARASNSFSLRRSFSQRCRALFEFAECAPLGDIGADPPTGKGGQIVGRNAGHRLARIRRGGLERDAVALEPQDAITQNVGRRQPVAQAIRHGPKIFADYHAATSHAFLRQLAQQIVKRIGDIGTLGGPGAVGDPKQANQPHHMVDAERAGVTHIGGDQFAKRAIAGAPPCEGIGRRQIPDLSFRREPIRRRADHGAARQIGGIGPSFGAVGRRAHREIAVKSQLQSGGPRPRGPAANCRSHKNCRNW